MTHHLRMRADLPGWGAVQPSVQWIVTLVCGASGAGKSFVARPLGARYGVPLPKPTTSSRRFRRSRPRSSSRCSISGRPTLSSGPGRRSGSPRGISRWPARFAPHTRRSSPTMSSSQRRWSSRVTISCLNWRRKQVPRRARWCSMSRTRTRLWRTTCDASPADSSATVPGSAPWSARSWPGGLDAAACRSSLPGHGPTASIASTKPCAAPTPKEAP